MRRLVISLVTVIAGTVVVVATAAGAASAGKHYATTIDVRGENPPGGTNPNVYIEFGQVHSTARACIAGRSLQMVETLVGGGHKVMDVGQSSKNGAFALVGNFNGFSSGAIKAARKVIGSGAKRKICDAASIPPD